jgi:hypothetical protein
MALSSRPIPERGQERLMRYPASTHDHHQSTQGSGNNHHKKWSIRTCELGLYLDDSPNLRNYSMDSNAMEAPAPALSLPLRSSQDPGLVMAFEDSMKQSEINGRRKMYPKEQWLVLRPIIQRLYVDEGQTFLKVAEYLHEHHNFNPT